MSHQISETTREFLSVFHDASALARAYDCDWGVVYNIATRRFSARQSQALQYNATSETTISKNVHQDVLGCADVRRSKEQFIEQFERDCVASYFDELLNSFVETGVFELV